MRQIPQPPKFWKNAPSDFAHFWGMGLLTTDFYSFDFEGAFSDMEIPFLGKTRTHIWILNLQHPLPKTH
jgi:hypothetical protein